ncbi:uncharacterized protein [Ptychodera flava]|uniref:uncharacterized protein n=1 Tax=Ptychodera flava TaxID=63121 RepID=UPI003969D6FC
MDWWFVTILTLTVLLVNGFFTEAQARIEYAYVGQDVNISCPIESIRSDVTLEWVRWTEKNGAFIAKKFLHGSEKYRERNKYIITDIPTLTIKNVTFLDGDAYRCRVILTSIKSLHEPKRVKGIVDLTVHSADEKNENSNSTQLLFVSGLITLILVVMVMFNMSNLHNSVTIPMSD